MDSKIKLLLGIAAGGAIVWYGWAMAHVFLNTGINIRQDLTLNHQIGIAPGQIFSSQGQFHHYFRLSYGARWSEKIDKGLRTLGELVKRY